MFVLTTGFDCELNVDSRGLQECPHIPTLRLERHSEELESHQFVSYAPSEDSGVYGVLAGWREVLAAEQTTGSVQVPWFA